MRIPLNQSNQGISTANAGAVASVPSINAFYKQGAWDGLANLSQNANKLFVAIQEESLKDKEKLESLEDMEALQRLEQAHQERDLENREKYQGKNAEGVDLDMLGYSKSLLEPELAKRTGERARYFALKANDIQNKYVNHSNVYKLGELEKYKSSILKASDDKLALALSDPNISAFDKQRMTNERIAEERAFNAEAFDSSGKEAVFNGNLNEAIQNDAFLRLQQEIDNGNFVFQADENNPNSVYYLAASKESGGRGSSAIGYDKNGGTSYGTYQFSSKQGTAQNFVDWLAQNGSPEVKERFAKLGGFNTGSKKGAAAQMWLACVKDGLITPELETKFIQERMVNPASSKLSPTLQQTIKDNPILGSAFVSTVIQHGTGGASRLMNEAYSKNKDGKIETLLHDLYEARKGNFPSSTPEVQASVARRLEEEKRSLIEHKEAVLNADFNKLSYPNQQKILNYSAQKQEHHRKLAEEQEENSIYQTLVKNNESLPFELQEANAFKVIDGYRDKPELQEKLSQRFKGHLERQKTVVKAQDQSIINQFLINMEKNKTGRFDALANVEQIEGLSREGKELLTKKLTEGSYNKKTALNQKATIDARRLVDNGTLKTQEEIDSYALDNELTFEQAEQLGKYYADGGKLGRFSQKDVDRVMLMLDVDPNKYDGEDIYQTILRTPGLLKDGLAPSVDNLRQIISGFIMDGETQDKTRTYLGYGVDENYLEAVKNKQGSQWLPDISELSAEEKARYAQTPEVQKMIKDGESEKTAIRRYYKRLKGLPE
ncbi:hypothetical protein [Desulfovibrio litoralis]|uniref:Type VI secretion system spike protein VgrG3-like C-terminal domain-containing protein n=1 Tax=Desulfovibrio litoralis DSM 11393 TaxID=1121455 RepID=A0A1M7T854_9BACT|nr:hypothetical protein [Desulfovibrio litoralis]SHN66884.1 hypothetical protein SAMN02745728_01705 [Desulfovibrio litoralis DSM 11393]